MLTKVAASVAEASPKQNAPMGLADDQACQPTPG